MVISVVIANDTDALYLQIQCTIFIQWNNTQNLLL